MTEVGAEVLARLSTPDRVESRIGALEFTDGAPTAKTVEKLYDHLDFVHGVNVFRNAFPAVSTQAIRQGFLSIGVEDNTVLIFSELMDSASRFLTANADTVYYLAFVDLTDGPMVVETPPMALGTFDDMWFQWIIDFGLPGPDRGAGGRFPSVPPRNDGPLPEGGFYIGHSRTNRALLLGRSFMQDDDPAPMVATIKSTTQAVPLHAGRSGHEHRHDPRRRRSPPGSRHGSSPDQVRGGERGGVQHHPAVRRRVLRDRARVAPGRACRRDRRRGHRSTHGDRHRQGQAVRARRPDATNPRRRRGGRERDVARADVRRTWRGRRRLLPGLRVDRRCCSGAATCSRGRSRRSRRRASSPSRAHGGRKLDLRTLFFYGYTGITPAMAMRLTGTRQPVPRGVLGLEQGVLRRSEVVHGRRCLPTSPRRGSGRSRCTTTRPDRCS